MPKGRHRGMIVGIQKYKIQAKKRVRTQATKLKSMSKNTGLGTGETQMNQPRVRRKQA